MAEQDKEFRNIGIDYINELNKRELSNSENYDKGILTLSSSGLAISIAVINFFFANNFHTGHLWLIIASWFFFSLAIISTLIGYIVGNLGFKCEIDRAHKYYFDNIPYDELPNNLYQKWISRINISSGIIFIIAIILFVTFVGINFSEQNIMKDTKQTSKTEPQLIKTTTMVITTGDSATIPQMIKKGANIPAMPRKEETPPTPTKNK